MTLYTRKSGIMANVVRLRLLGNEEDRRSLHSEVAHLAGRQLTPNHAGVWNPAFASHPQSM